MQGKQTRLTLSDEQRQELEDLRDHAVQPYVRERAGALLKIGQGQSATRVARQGLLKEREPETVLEWVARYQEEGISGLHIREGRGRHPAFFPPERATSASNPDGSGASSTE